jgi:hypothetical protein
LSLTLTIMKVHIYLFKLMKATGSRCLNLTTCLMVLVLAFCFHQGFGQYVHPNQAGRKGGETGPGLGGQVVTSTYLGNAGSLHGQGVIMSVNKDGTNAASFHDFKGVPGDGSYPYYTTPHQGSDGKLYGSTYLGGTSNYGAVYTYDFAKCSEFVIHNSAYGVEGGSAGQYANVNELSDGKIYFLETYGGASLLGALYRMDKSGDNRELLHTFTYASGTHPTYTAAAATQVTDHGLSAAYHYDGAYPYGFVVEGADGKIYGSTYAGGPLNLGTWYRCNKDGSGYEVLRFGSNALKTYKTGTNADVSAYHLYTPWGNVAQDQAGKIYLTGYYGGAGNYGGVARMDPDGSNYQLLVSGSAANGTYPYRGALIIDDKVYGTFRTNGGGNAVGVVYGMNLDGTAYTKLKTFDYPYTDGADPCAGLSYDGTHLFSTTLTNGGSGAVGTIFKIKPDGTDFQKIHTFLNTSTAVSPGCEGTNKTGLYTYYPSAERVTFADVKLSCSVSCIANPAPCTAPNTAPPLSSTTLSNTCPATTADLTTLNSDPTVSWHSATPALASNRLADPSKVTAGTYYAAYYDAVNDCYSQASSGPVTVSIVYCSSTLRLNANSYAITTQVNTHKDGSIVTDLNPQGTPPFTYSWADCATGADATSTENGGTVLVSTSTGGYTYYPPADYTGIDSYCVKICDGSPAGTCKIVTYTVTVTPEDCDARGTVPAN